MTTEHDFDGHGARATALAERDALTARVAELEARMTLEFPCS